MSTLTTTLKEVEKELQKVLAFLEEEVAAYSDLCGDDDEHSTVPAKEAKERLEKAIKLL